MNSIRYIFIATLCLSLFYAVYQLIFRRETNFRQLRIYLLASMLLSMVIPLSTYRIDLELTRSAAMNNITTTVQHQQEIQQPSTTTIAVPAAAITRHHVTMPWKEILVFLYAAIALLLLIRLIIQSIILTVAYIRSKKVKFENYVISYNKRFSYPFSFFNLIFISQEQTSHEDIDKIIAHEKIHASQYHALDLILVELLSAVMWFNPLIWMMKNTIQLVHEYLADEGALSTGIDKLQYQALLLNQVAEERFIGLSSSFNHSLIKKRMIMMTKSNFNQRTKLKILMLVPVAVILLLGVACVNGQVKQDRSTKGSFAVVSPEKMNVLYIGVDNPVAIAVPAIEPSELSVSIDNGRINGSNGQYNVYPAKEGMATITVSSKGRVIDRKVFRVKIVPDPVAEIDGKKGGTIDKQTLLEQNEVKAVMENFDFDLSFNIVQFTVSAVYKGLVKEYTSKSGKITKEQKELIKKLSPGSNIYFQDIKCKGPDGKLRSISTIKFTIK